MAATMYGTYNRLGYSIYMGDSGEPIYEAGNSGWDSQAYLDATDPDALPLDVLSRYCISTGQEIAQEQGAEWLGCDMDEEEA